MATITTTDWTVAPVLEFIDHIVSSHHEYLKRRMPEISALLEHSRAGNPAVVRALEGVWFPFVEEMNSHLWKEENVLFPMVRSGQTAHCGGIQNPIRVMMMEHDSADQALRDFRRITSDYNAVGVDAINAAFAELEEDLRAHMYKENEILFPRLVK